jgi:hypothetical protein
MKTDRLAPLTALLRRSMATCFLAAGCLPLTAQVPAQAPSAADPYSEGDPVLLAKAGIEALAPFPWADDHDTRDIQQELGVTGLRWAETRHFKIGIDLKDRPLPVNQAERQDLLAEIGRLAQQLPKLKQRPKVVDSWLLVHLYAARLEALYADFAARTGWKVEAPPTPAGGSDGRGWSERGGVGSGPYLGQHGKFCLLIVEQRSELARYLQRFAGRKTDEPAAHYFKGSTSIVYVTTPDTRWDALRTERGLYCNVVYGMAHHFAAGFHGFAFETPAWVGEGVGHWYRRRVDENYDSFASVEQSQVDLVQGTDWRRKTRARVEGDNWARAADLLVWRASDTAPFDRHVMMWSRVDYLLSLGDERFARFLTELKNLPTTGVPYDEVCRQQVLALQKAYDMDPAAFDARWCQWVRKTYPRK